MPWKRLVVLGLAGVLVIGAVVALARIIIPDEPNFAEDLEDATENPEGSLEFIPNAIGGELKVTGAREGTITLDRQLSRPSFGLGDGQASVFFEPDPLRISQMSYDGLAFFPEPEACEFTEGQHNEGAGIVAVQVTCAELTDIRDNGSISLDGYAALPVTLVLEGIPRPGGTVRVGNDEWTVGESTLLIGGSFGDDDVGFWLGSIDSHPLAFYFSYDLVTGELTLTRVGDLEQTTDVPPEACEVGTEELDSPGAQVFMEMEFSCARGQLPVTVPASGTAVFELIDVGG